MKRGKVRTAKSPGRPRIDLNNSKKQRLKDYVKQIVTLLALQQAVMRNLEREINNGK